jgi:hypothetical protein
MQRIKYWRWNTLAALWLIAVFQTWIAFHLVTLPLPVKETSSDYYLVITTIMMIVESAIVATLALIVVSWKWFMGK